MTDDKLHALFYKQLASVNKVWTSSDKTLFFHLCAISMIVSGLVGPAVI